MCRSLFFASLLIALGSSGCEHQLSISNAPPSPFAASGLDRRVSIGVVNRSSAENTEGFVEAVAKSLQLNGNVERVIYPYLPRHRADVVAYLDVNPKYRGAGTNFFVSWPGFLIFTPAWHGYSYHADVTTRVEMVASNSNQHIGSFDWHHDYEFKQADIGRSWVEVGWLEWSVIPLIGGFFAMQYDTDQTDPFIRSAGPSYGNQISGKIAGNLINFQTASTMK
jgi:hypothetical protein